VWSFPPRFGTCSLLLSPFSFGWRGLPLLIRALIFLLYYLAFLPQFFHSPFLKCSFSFLASSSKCLYFFCFACDFELGLLYRAPMLADGDHVHVLVDCQLFLFLLLIPFYHARLYVFGVKRVALRFPPPRGDSCFLPSMCLLC